MNPAILTAVSSIGSGIKNIPRPVWIGGGVIIGGLLLGRYLQKQHEKAVFENTQKKFGENTKEGKAVEYANLLFSAMFPSGYTWMPDGTDEKALYAIADKMKKNRLPFSLVSQMYRNLYNRELMKDLQGELSTSELHTFQNAITG